MTAAAAVASRNTSAQRRERQIRRHHEAPALVALADEAEQQVGALLVERHVAYDARAADLIFQLVSRRYEHRSLLITTNLPFKRWDTVFPNASCAVALIDRLTHHVEILRIEGRSYRRREAELSQQERSTSSTDGRLSTSEMITSSSSPTARPSRGALGDQVALDLGEQRGHDLRLDVALALALDVLLAAELFGQKRAFVPDRAASAAFRRRPAARSTCDEVRHNRLGSSSSAVTVYFRTDLVGTLNAHRQPTAGVADRKAGGTSCRSQTRNRKSSAVMSAGLSVVSVSTASPITTSVPPSLPA